MSNPPKIRIVCSHCRSESVTRDANASWNPDTQDWELEGVMDAAYCNDCGGECSLEEVPYRPRRDGLNSDFANLHEDHHHEARQRHETVVHRVDRSVRRGRGRCSPQRRQHCAEPLFLTLHVGT